jgi:hypothetical protein
MIRFETDWNKHHTSRVKELREFCAIKIVYILVKHCCKYSKTRFEREFGGERDEIRKKWRKLCGRQD